MDERSSATYLASMSDDLEAILFGFLQAAFFGTAPSDTAPDFDDALDRLSRFRTLRVETVLEWPLASRVALKELLIGWIVVIRTAETTGASYSVPQGWLNGASSTRLTDPIVAEILRRSDALQSQYRRRQQEA